MKRFEFAILFRPKGNDEKAKMLVGVNDMFAEDEKEVLGRAMEQVPADYLNRLEEVAVVLWAHRDQPTVTYDGKTLEKFAAF